MRDRRARLTLVARQVPLWPGETSGHRERLSEARRRGVAPRAGARIKMPASLRGVSAAAKVGGRGPSRMFVATPDPIGTEMPDIPVLVPRAHETVLCAGALRARPPDGRAR